MPAYLPQVKILNRPVSVIVPVYNLGGEINHNVRHLISFLNYHLETFELIVVDDGSTDDTAAQLKNLSGARPLRVVSLAANQGKAAALRAGIAVARGEFVVFTDADLPYQLTTILTIFDKLAAGYDLVIGSRDLPESTSLVSPGFGRTFLSHLFSFLANLLLPQKIGDTQCGLKGFSRRAGQRLFSQTKINGFCFDVELLYVAQTEGLRIGLVPVALSNIAKTSIRFSHECRMLFDLVYLAVRRKLIPQLTSYTFKYRDAAD